MKFVNDFRAWAFKECSEFENKRKEAYIKSCMGGIDGRYHYHSYGNKTIILDMETGKTGIAQCKKSDEFSIITGIGVAWARLKGEEIPMERIETIIKNLKSGDKFTFLYGSEKVYTFIYYYNVNSIERCFCATGEDLVESFAVSPGMKVLKV